jgi:type I restriction enzyme S subunit
MRAPVGWLVAHLRDVASVQTGFAKGKTASEGAVSVPYLRVANVQDGYVILANVTNIDVTPTQVERYGLRSGDVLFTEGGDFNKLGRGTVWRGQISPCLHQNHVFAVRPAADKLLPEFLAALAASSHGRRYFQSASKQSTNLASINSTQLKTFPLLLPPLPVQRKIAEILRTWDDAIGKTLELRRLADARRGALAERVLAPSPEIRRKLSQLTKPIKTRNSASELGRESVMGVSNRSGLVAMREQTIAADISRYQVLPPRAFAYNPMRINVGSIAMSRLESHVLVSPDYVLFQCDERELSPEYLDHVLRTRWWLHHVNAGASGSVRTRTYYDDLAAISIAAPPVAEQENISLALDGLDMEIELLRRKAELLRTQKRGLMQKLLTGQVCVNVAADIEPGRQDDD